MPDPAARPPQPDPAQPDPQIDAGVDLSRWFAPAEPAAWRAAAEAALKGKPWAKVMELALPGGLRAPALAVSPPGPEALATSRLCRQGPWEACAEHDLGLPADDDALAEAIADDLRHGASSISLRDPGAQGWDPARLCALLAGAPAGDFGLWLDGRGAGGGGRAALAALDAARGPAAATPWGGLLLDPIGPLLRGEEHDLDAAFDAAAAAVQAGDGRVRALLSGLPWAEAGAPAPLELGALLAGALALLRALADRGISAADAIPRLRLQLGVGADMVLEISKLRALRRLWAKLGLALGLDPAASRVDLHARQLELGLCAYDLHSNALRATVAGVAAAVGGADAISLRPYDAPLRAGGAAARRLAQHTHLLLLEEGHLGALDDLAGGAHSVEGLTDALCAAAWAQLQRLEAAGGLQAALAAGWPQAEVAAEAARLRAAVDSRQRPLVGLSDFAWTGELRPAARAPLAAPRTAGGPAPLPPLRLGAAFEALRDAAGATPRTVFLACVGAPARHAARAGFAEGALTAGGLRPQRPATAWSGGPPGEGPPTPAEEAALDALAAEARAIGAAAAVICGDEADAARLALPLLQRLAPLPTLLAGRPAPEAAAALEAAGLCGSLALGAPIASALAALHARLGLTPPTAAEAR